MAYGGESTNPRAFEGRRHGVVASRGLSVAESAPASCCSPTRPGPHATVDAGQQTDLGTPRDGTARRTGGVPVFDTCGIRAPPRRRHAAPNRRCGTTDFVRFGCTGKPGIHVPGSTSGPACAPRSNGCATGGIHHLSAGGSQIGNAHPTHPFVDASKPQPSETANWMPKTGSYAMLSVNNGSQPSSGAAPTRRENLEPSYRAMLTAASSTLVTTHPRRSATRAQAELKIAKGSRNSASSASRTSML